MGMCVQILDLPADQRDPSRKDGALHVIGQVAETLIKVSCNLYALTSFSYYNLHSKCT